MKSFGEATSNNVVWWRRRPCRSWKKTVPSFSERGKKEARAESGEKIRGMRVTSSPDTTQALAKGER